MTEPRVGEVEESQLVRAVAAGSQDALAALYDRHAESIYALALRMSDDRGVAEEVVQETFLVLWNRAERFDPETAALGTWLRSIARNRTIDRLRAAGRRPRLVSIGSDDPESSDGEAFDRAAAGGSIVGGAATALDPHDSLERVEAREAIRSALAGMPDDERMVILLAYQAELTQTEIADRLGWPLGTVKTRTRRALRRLRVVLGDSIGSVGLVEVAYGADEGSGRLMEHREALELLEQAAVEPSGFERLAAGDTPEAGALASHLAGCETCTAEFEALGRTSATIRATVREMPPADLRERTLAFVAATGRTTPAVVEAAPTSGARPAPAEPTTPAIDAPARTIAARRRTSWWPPLAAAAMLVAAVSIGGWWVARGDLDQEQAVTAELASVTEASLYVQAQPDDQIVALAGTDAASTATGSMSYSASATELVVFADGLTDPPAGSAYRCWIEVGGVREFIGPMHLGGGKAYWAGWHAAATGLGPGVRFGVALGSSDADLGTDVLVGVL